MDPIEELIAKLKEIYGDNNVVADKLDGSGEYMNITVSVLADTDAIKVNLTGAATTLGDVAGNYAANSYTISTDYNFPDAFEFSIRPKKIKGRESINDYKINANNKKFPGSGDRITNVLSMPEVENALAKVPKYILRMTQDDGTKLAVCLYNLYIQDETDIGYMTDSVNIVAVAFKALRSTAPGVLA